MTLPTLEEIEGEQKQTDADKVREAFEKPQEERKGPGRPKGSKTGAKARSEQARRAALAGVEKRRQREAEASATPSQQDQEFWARQVQSLWNNVAELRKWPTIPDEALPNIGEPAALTARQFLPMADDRPWLALLLVLSPFIGGAMRVEYQRFNASRRQLAPRDERGRVRAEGQRQDDAREESYIGTPITQPGDDR